MNKALLICFMIAGARALAGPAGLEVVRTEKVLQLTGDFDRERQEATLSRTETRAGVVATDLGSSFEHKGRLAFLFGDTWGKPGDRDFLAFSEATEPGELSLTIPTGEDGTYVPIEPGDLETGAFCVPSCGISLNGIIYIIYTGDVAGRHMSESHLLKSADDGRTWEVLYRLSGDDPETAEFEGRFINGYFAEEPDGTVYLWGSGKYRASDLYLAKTTRDRIEDPDGWVYFTGLNSEGEPQWSSQESESGPLFRSGQIGEFSCVSFPAMERWVLLYNSADPRGIALRMAREPWGPWSDAEIVFDPGRHGGYGHFMHIPANRGGTDELHDPHRENEWGGEYGPYSIPRFFRAAGGEYEIYYTMSTWNPYQVVLMRSVLVDGK